MSGSRDNVLIAYFKEALSGADWAARLVCEGMVVYASGKVILYVPDEVAEKADKALSKPVARKSSMAVPVEKVLPENMLRPERFAPSAEAWEAVVNGGGFLYVPSDKGGTLVAGKVEEGVMEAALVEDAGLVGKFSMLFVPPRSLMDGAAASGSMSAFGTTLAFTAGADVPCFTMVGENVSLCTTACFGDRPLKLKMPDKAWYTCMAGDNGIVLEKKRSDKMKGLGSPLKAAKPVDVMEVAQQQAAEEPARAEVREEVKAPVEEPKPAVEEKPKQAVPKPTPKPAPKEPPKQEPVQAPAKEEIPADAVLEESVADVAEAQAVGDRQRQRKTPLVATKKHLAAWQAVSDEISAPTGEIQTDNLDFLLEEERVLRDLIMVASRRLFNLNMAAVKGTKEAVDKYAAIKSLLK